MPFRAVNRNGLPGYDPGLQRHHVLPRQLLGHTAFARMFSSLGRERTRFEDFRENGLLLPCDEAAALRMALPLHRGPHPLYTKLVMERVGQIEAAWARARRHDAGAAAVAAHMRLDLLQRALKRYLLAAERRNMRLNRNDPFLAPASFAALDEVADGLWSATAPAGPMPPSLQPMPVRRSSSFLAD
nr:AHH domain-containing protein [Novosphingobium silvae]